MNSAGSDTPFRDYHRARRWRTARVRAAIGMAVVAVVLPQVLTVVHGDAGLPAAAALPTVLAAPAGEDLATQAVSAEPAPAEPVDAPTPPATADLPAFLEPAPHELEITLDAVGHQAEIDRCLWVAMDLDVVAPIVAAHNYCGGSVLLELGVGDTVRVHGFGLDGRYLVTGDREVTTSQNAAIATEGLVADLILQTCYWHTGTTRLVTTVAIDD